MLEEMKPEITAALIAAITSTILTPIVQLVIDSIKTKKAYNTRIAPILEHIRILHQELLQVPLNPNMQGVNERIAEIENFYDPIFNEQESHDIKVAYVKNAKHLAARHKQSRPWMEIEYPEEKLFLNNNTERFLAVIQKTTIPELFDPTE